MYGSGAGGVNIVSGKGVEASWERRGTGAFADVNFINKVLETKFCRRRRLTGRY